MMQNPQVQQLVHDPSSGIVHRSDLLRDVALRFLVSDCDLFAVTDSCGRLAGVITESTVVRSLLSNPLPTTTIESFVTTHVDSVRSTALLNSVLHLFRASCHTAVPVIDVHDRVCGLLLRRDVMAAMLSTTETGNGTSPVATPNSVSQVNHDIPAGPVVPDPQGIRLKFGAARVDPADAVRSAGAPIGRPSAEHDESKELTENDILKGNFSGHRAPGDIVEPTPANGDHSAPCAASDRAADAGSSADSRQSGPHFLKGEAARRRLDAQLDFRGGFHEDPW